MTELDNFLKLLHPNKNLDEIKINPVEFEKKNNNEKESIQKELRKPNEKEIEKEIENNEETKEKPISRKEKRFNERREVKKNKPVKETLKNTQKIALALKLEKVKVDTRIDLTKRLGPIIFGPS